MSETFKNYALPDAVRRGEELYSAGAVTGVEYSDSSYTGKIKERGYYRAAFKGDTGSDLNFSCSCGFSAGGACRHVIALMLYVENSEAVQSDAFGAGSYSDSDEQQGLQYGEREQESEIVSLKGDPRGRIYLRTEGDTLLVFPSFVYDSFESEVQCDAEVEFSYSEQRSEKMVTLESGRTFLVKRSKLKENRMVQDLLDMELRRYGRGRLIPEESEEEWVNNTLPVIASKGFEVYGHKGMLEGMVREEDPELRVSVSGDEEGFVCSISCEFNGIPSSLAELIEAVANGNRYLLLSDGTTGKLPERMLSKLRHAFSYSEFKGGQTIDVDRFNTGVLEEVEEVSSSFRIEDRVRERISGNQGIHDQDTPEGLNAVLRSYQKHGYNWLIFLDSCGVGGCLADDMGLGKTLQIISFLLYLKEKGEAAEPSLIVMPASLLFNWEEEIERFAPSLIYAVYYGRNRERMLSSLSIADVVISSYGTVLRDIKRIQSLRFNYLILDESQYIKNPGAGISRALRGVNASNKIAVTGTPVENSALELWSLFSVINPGMFGPLKGFKEEFLNSDEDNIRFLGRIIYPYILRRTKEQVAGDLPPKTEKVQYLDMEEEQRHIYNITREATIGRVMSSIENKGIERSGVEIIECMLRLRQVCCHPALIDSGYAGGSVKFLFLESFLENLFSEGHKVLIFSQFTSLLDILAEDFREKGIAYSMLTGRTGNRKEAVKRFQERSDVTAFLISLKAGGTGLNLTSADYVVHMDPWWNPAVERQATDRAYRIGQEKHVFVYKLITRDTIEERVLTRQSMKQKIVETLISEDTSMMKKLTEKDILSLFS
ncbi:MAG: SNF2-related protein [Chitinivibrionales bacterium]